jgi:uncharacterized protein
MSDPFVPRVGGVVSADIAVPEHERELDFYAQVLTTGAAPLWRADLMNNRGTPIIGLGARIPEYAHLPLQWMPHIQVADVAASAKRAVDLGGKTLMLDDNSQWAVLRDPNGAAFGIIPVVPAEALPKADESAPPCGHIAWLDLTVPDAVATRDFYQAVVGWSVQELEMHDGDGRYADFLMIAGDGKPAAGVCHARGVNQDLPPVWMLYLPVGDLEESIRRVQARGGKVHKCSQNKNGQLAYAAIQDPIGVNLALMPG